MRLKNKTNQCERAGKWEIHSDLTQDCPILCSIQAKPNQPELPATPSQSAWVSQPRRTLARQQVPQPPDIAVHVLCRVDKPWRPLHGPRAPQGTDDSNSRPLHLCVSAFPLRRPEGHHVGWESFSSFIILGWKLTLAVTPSLNRG